MDVPVYPIIVTVVEECRLVFKKTAVRKSWNWFIFEYPKSGIALLTCLLFLIIRSPANSNRKRGPKIKRTIITYNAILFFFHLFSLCRCISFWIRVISWACEYEDLFSLRISSAAETVVDITGDIYVFSTVKILELMDTIFAVLLKKHKSNRLINFYHRTLLIILSWTFSNYMLNSHIALLFMTLNSCINGIKYVYYESSIIFRLTGMWTQQLFKKFLQLVTTVQYIILLLYAGYLIAFDDDIHRPTPTLIVANTVILIYLLTRN